MSSEMFERSMRNRTMWVGTLWFAAVAIAGAILHRALGAAGALALASVYGFGTIGMAWLTMRATPFPMWSWIATSGVMALALELSAVLSGPAQLKAWANTAWMFPWLFLTVAITPPSRLGWCERHARASGWLLLGLGAVYTLILLGVMWL